MKKIIITILILSALFLVGCDSARSVLYSEINGKGELVIYYSDGTEENLGLVVGRDGKNGKDGIDGINGIDGIDGIDGKNGKDGIDGKDGQDGADGKDGKDGIDGEDGKDGINVGEVDQFDITVNTSGGESAAAVSKAILSSVSVICKITPISATADPAYSLGAGVIYYLDKVNGDAFIITNYHVVFNSKSGYEKGISEDISVYLYGNEYAEGAIKAEFVGGSLTYDIAVLKVSGSEALIKSSATAATVSDSDTVALGQDAIAIGNSEGNGISVTKGIVSVISENLDLTGADGATEVTLRVLRMDTPVNHGNSGGGLYNSNGDLIGIVSAKLIDEDIEGMGYSIPSNLAKALVDNILDNCLNNANTKIQKPLLGITVTTSESHSYYDSESGTVRISETVVIVSTTDTSAFNGLLIENDVLLSISINGKKQTITRQYHILDALLTARVGDTVTLEYKRGETVSSVSTTLTESSIISVE